MQLDAQLSGYKIQILKLNNIEFKLIKQDYYPMNPVISKTFTYLMLANGFAFSGWVIRNYLINWWVFSFDLVYSYHNPSSNFAR